MCTYSLSFNDALMERVRLAFPNEEAVMQWMQQQMDMMLLNLVAQQEKNIKGKEGLSMRLRGIISLPEDFDYKEELANRCEI